MRPLSLPAPGRSRVDKRLAYRIMAAFTARSVHPAVVAWAADAAEYSIILV